LDYTELIKINSKEILKKLKKFEKKKKKKKKNHSKLYYMMTINFFKKKFGILIFMLWISRVFLWLMVHIGI